MQRHRRANVEKKGLEPFGEPSLKTLVSLIKKQCLQYKKKEVNK